jgi:hypothetical protein
MRSPVTFSVGGFEVQPAPHIGQHNEELGAPPIPVKRRAG